MNTLTFFRLNNKAKQDRVGERYDTFFFHSDLYKYV